MQRLLVLIFLLLLVLGGMIVHRFPPEPVPTPPAASDASLDIKAAEKVFRRFTTLLLTGPREQALALSLGNAREGVARGEPLTNRAGDTIIVQAVLDKGEARILATQVVQDRGVANAPPQFHRQNATLIWTPEGWRVSAFDDQLEECCQ